MSLSHLGLSGYLIPKKIHFATFFSLFLCHNLRRSVCAICAFYDPLKFPFPFCPAASLGPLCAPLFSPLGAICSFSQSFFLMFIELLHQLPLDFLSSSPPTPPCDKRSTDFSSRPSNNLLSFPPAIDPLVKSSLGNFLFFPPRILSSSLCIVVSTQKPKAGHSPPPPPPIPLPPPPPPLTPPNASERLESLYFFFFVFPLPPPRAITPFPSLLFPPLSLCLYPFSHAFRFS